MGCPVLGLRPRPGRGERRKNFACGGRKFTETLSPFFLGEHVHDLRSGEVYQTSASANQRWTARCGGSTVQVWDVRTGRATAFEVPADTPLPVNRGRGRRVAAAR